MRIALIGTGNVAWHLAQASIAAGHQLVAVTGHTVISGEEFAQAFTLSSHTRLADIKHLPVDIVFIAVPDATLTEVAAKLEVQPETIVAHTSGSQPITSLDSIKGGKTGVFYPVQTFTKYKPLDFSQVPVLIEGSDKEAEGVLQQFGETFSKSVQVKDSASRRQLHLAAVFACNFTNHLFGISQSILEAGGLSTNLLQPLIKETIAKSEIAHPFKVQTGPAARNDENVIQEHIQRLKHHPSWQELYHKLTQSIQEQQRNTNTATSEN